MQYDNNAKIPFTTPDGQWGYLTRGDLRALVGDTSPVEPEHATCARCHEVGDFAALESNSGVCGPCMTAADA